ncbi:MAG: DUF4058 family protein [Gemmataceae bacterium]|nr:DUF4058 family protein [Gemmataceae bacterium]
MHSPFPGMDPYLEQHWGDVHLNLISHAAGMLNERLPPDLRARAQERIIVDLPSAERSYFPDLRVVERSGRSGTAVALSGVIVAEPLEVPFLEPETQGFLEIIETRPQRRVVTVLEVLSPSNKYAGRGHDLYRQKQRDLADGAVSLVEIDLLRSGPHVLQVPLAQYPPAYRTPYKVCVHRGWKAGAEIYRLPLREPLPAIRVPLRETDADVPLDLQALITQVYRHGRYDDIDYTLPPVPPLDADDATWADELLRAAGQRPAAAGG